MPKFSRKSKKIFKSLMGRKRWSRYRSQGTGRGYRPGYNRFGRVSGPELKTKVLTRDGVTAAATVQQLIVWPNITQGIQEDQRIGNRINAKFLNIKLLLMSQRVGETPPLPLNPPVIRYVLWTTKDSTTAAGASTAMNNLTLVNFLNTKQNRIMQTGYITLSGAGTAKVKSINWNFKNRVIDFIANTDITANTGQHVYLTLYSNQIFNWEHQSKFYFADP